LFQIRFLKPKHGHNSQVMRCLGYSCNGFGDLYEDCKKFRYIQKLTSVNGPIQPANTLWPLIFSNYAIETYANNIPEKSGIESLSTAILPLLPTIKIIISSQSIYTSPWRLKWAYNRYPPIPYSIFCHGPARHPRTGHDEDFPRKRAKSPLLLCLCFSTSNLHYPPPPAGIPCTGMAQKT